MATPLTRHSGQVQFIFHGTGNSGSIPYIQCLTAPEGNNPCETCLSTRRPEGKKNIRRNTGAILHVDRPSGGKATIVIDVGKNFVTSALEWFPKYELRRIDAVIITHPHADAMNGLDDLRGWTLGGAIQTHIDVYTSQATFTQVERAFPYLVSKEFASGGGDVPQFKWHMIDANRPFVVGDTGVEVTPFIVHHGRLFTNSSPSGWLPTPVSSHPSTPQSVPSTPQLCPSTPQLVPSTPQLSPSTPLQTDNLLSPEGIQPYLCFGFIIFDIVYMSDVSHIPEATWAVIEAAKKRSYSMFVVDCLRIQPHTSHFGIAQAVVAARRLQSLGGKTLRTYLVGFSHDIPHSKWNAIGKSLDYSGDGTRQQDDDVRYALEHVPKGPPLWLRPAYDGLRVFLEDGRTWQDDSDSD